MSDELICPDCGGIIGATEITDEGKPCQCFAVAKKTAVATQSPSAAFAKSGASAQPLPTESLRAMGLNPVELYSITDSPPAPGDSSGNSGTHEALASSGFSQASVSPQGPVVSKLCFKCGKDVAGHQRVKDSRGYMCMDCHRAEVAEEKANPRCADCSRRVKEAALVEFEGRRICGKCRSDHMAIVQHEQRFSPIKAGTYKEAEKQQIKWMVGIVAVLLFIIILHKLHILGGFF
jgi:hypothetical protein